jgi:hypothetical protein
MLTPPKISIVSLQSAPPQLVAIPIWPWRAAGFPEPPLQQRSDFVKIVTVNRDVTGSPTSGSGLDSPRWGRSADVGAQLEVGTPGRDQRSL